MKEMKSKVTCSVIIYVIASIILQFILMYFVEKNAQIEIIAINSAITGWITGCLYLMWYYLHIEKYRMAGIVLLCTILGFRILAWFWTCVTNNVKTENSVNYIFVIVNSIFYICMFNSAEHKARLYNERLDLK